MAETPPKNDKAGTAWCIGIGVAVLFGIGALSGGNKSSSTTPSGSGSDGASSSSWCQTHKDDQAYTVGGEFDQNTKRYLRECAGLDIGDD